MIDHLSGEVLFAEHDWVVLNVRDVGYGLKVPPRSVTNLRVGQSLSLWTSTYVREDALRLFGFLSRAEKSLFELMLTISGVGPKVALGIVDRVTPSALCDSALADDDSILRSVPGVGPKQSKKIMLEIKSKVPVLAAFAVGSSVRSAAPVLDEKSTALRDLESALANLGYKDREYKPVVRKVLADHQDKTGSLSELLRVALAELRQPNMAMADSPGMLFDKVTEVL